MHAVFIDLSWISLAAGKRKTLTDFEGLGCLLDAELQHGKTVSSLWVAPSAVHSSMVGTQSWS